MRQRQKVILRQMVRPPYVYRWAVLVGTVSTVVALSTTAISAQVSAATGPEPAARPAVASPPDVPRLVSPSLLTLTARPGRTVALTFDDGPHPDYTPKVLELLRQHDAVATFCITGDQARAHPRIVRDIVDAGMTLCDHTVAHDVAIGQRSAAGIERELVRSDRAISAAAGRDVDIRFFRAPEGRWTSALQDVAARRGLWSLGWSVDTLDWTRPGVGSIVDAVTSQVRPGAVVLFHDGGGPRDQTVVALARVLPWLVANGYTFDVPA